MEAPAANSAAEAATMAGGKRNKWMTHVRKTMKAHKGKPFAVVLKMAKKTYKGGAEGAAERTTLSPLPLSGGAALSPMPVATETGSLVGARRKSRKTRKGGRKSRKTSRKH
jgi:hypothetical protein